MIFDQQNMFFDKVKVTATNNGNTIANIGGGDAHDPLFIVVHASTAITAASGCTATLETADDDKFSSNKVAVAKYTLPASKKGLLLAAKLPYGMKKFIRLTVEGATGGEITAGLTATAPNWP